MLEDYRDEIAQLRLENAHFAKIVDEHKELNELIDNANKKRVNLSDEEIERLKRKKLLLKDKIYHMIIEFRKEKMEA